MLISPRSPPLAKYTSYRSVHKTPSLWPLHFRMFCFWGCTVQCSDEACWPGSWISLIAVQMVISWFYDFISSPYISLLCRRISVLSSLKCLHIYTLQNFLHVKISIISTEMGKKTFQHASNAGVNFFLAQVKCGPNFTLFCRKSDLCRDFALFGVILEGFYLINF